MSLDKGKAFLGVSQEVTSSSSMYMKEEAAGAQGRPLLCSVNLLPAPAF